MSYQACSIRGCGLGDLQGIFDLLNGKSTNSRIMSDLFSAFSSPPITTYPFLQNTAVLTEGRMIYSKRWRD